MTLQLCDHGRAQLNTGRLVASSLKTSTSREYQCAHGRIISAFRTSANYLTHGERCLRCLLLVMCTHPSAKKALTLHLARSEGHERYFGCNLMHRKVLASSHQHLMAEAPACTRGAHDNENSLGRRRRHRRSRAFLFTHSLCLCLLFIHPGAPNLISLRSAGTMPA